MTKVCSLDEALSCIRDGDTISSVGVIGWLVPDRLLEGISERFLAGHGAKGLTFYFPVSVGDALSIKGMDHIAKTGLLRRIISGNYINPLDPKTGRRSELMRLIIENQIEAYAWPIGASTHWLREVARRGPGYFTKVGLGTFIDPRQEGGRLNERTREQLVHLRELEGREYLFYPTFPLDIGLLRATKADEFGNLSLSGEPIHSASLALALAVKACGGKVIAQVKEIVPRSSVPAAQMHIPGVLVDHIVIEPNAMMTTEVRADTRYLGGTFVSSGFEPLAPGFEKVIARRAARELREGEVSIFGFGAATNIPRILIEDGRFDNGGIHRYIHTTEHGGFGGVVMSGWQFSANLFPEALIDGPSQFDFIDGGNCQFAALSFAQLDEDGNLNVSKFAGFSPGSGGFIDIATNTKRLVFVGTFSTGGLEVEMLPDGLRIQREGKIKKFVKRVDQITYPLRKGVLERNQDVTIITERAVFKMSADGLILTEIAEGIDRNRDVLELMDCGKIALSPNLTSMNAECFQE